MDNNQKEYIRKLKMDMSLMWGKKQRLKSEFLNMGLTSLELFALYQIYEVTEINLHEEKIYVSDLAKRMEILPPSLSRVLKGLEKKELIERRVEQLNRRNVYVLLSEKGKEVLFTCSDRMDRLLKSVVEEMGQQEIDKMFELWRKWTSVIERQSDLLKN